MRRSDNRAALTDEVARFQAEITRLAFATIREIVQRELDRRRAGQPAPSRAKPRPKRGVAAPRMETRSAPSAAQLSLGLGESAAAQAAAAAAGDPSTGEATGAAPPAPGDGTAPSAESAPEPGGRGRKRVPWTREAIIKELASWMSSGTAIDATFVTRHGPPGLVAATRRVFGRFEAALNVAGLHVSKLYPDGPPGRQQ